MRNKKKGFTLTFLSSLLVTLSVILTLGISIFVGTHGIKDALIANTLTMNRINAEKLAVTTNDLFNSMKNSLAVTADLLERDWGRGDIQKQLDLFRSVNQNFNSIYFVDPQGIMRQSSPRNELQGTKLTSSGSAEAIMEKKPLVSDPYIGGTSKPLVQVSQPLFNREGVYLGYIGGSIMLQEKNIFQTILGSYPDIQTGSYIFVVNSKGQLIYHPNASRIGDDVTSNPSVDEVLHEKSGQQRVVNTRGVDMLAGYAPVPVTRWGVIVQTPTQSVVSLTSQLVSSVLKYTLPGIALLLIIAWLIAVKISKPLYLLAEYARTISNQEHNLKLPMPRSHNWNYETNQLRSAIGLAVSRMQSQMNHLSLQAQTDALTGLHNRRSLDARMEKWAHDEMPLCMLVLDIDRFKSVNDMYGHDRGDDVLKYLAQTMEHHVRESGVCFRYGGEEFVIVLPNVSKQTAYDLAEQLRAAVEVTVSPINKPITVSIGLSASDECGYAGLFAAADRALYRAKQSGRNRTVTA
ncbi:sensor domain-containing diguanylate cyclase [Paenibacillus thalictri]|nr:sensor domain-containing diguanylate cyclase [Paenibacillus thalictri]